jgi:hypothetical protein
VPRPLILPIGSIMKFNGTRVTDHNRQGFSITPEKIEFKKRMANGTLRKFVVDEKRRFKAVWKSLPKLDEQTADGFMGAESIIDFYNSNIGAFNLTVTYGDNSTEVISVMFQDISYRITNRSIYTDLYEIDLSMEEV